MPESCASAGHRALPPGISHRRMALLPSPAASALPSGEKTTQRNQPPGKVCVSLPDATSKTRTARVKLVQAATSLPSGDRDAPVTPPALPPSALNFFTSLCVPASQRRTVPSVLPEATVLPSAENVTARVPAVCPSSWAVWLPLATSHRRTALS